MIANHQRYLAAIENQILGHTLPAASINIRQSLILGNHELPLVSQLPVGTESISLICHPGWCRKHDKAFDLAARYVYAELNSEGDRASNLASKFIDFSLDENGLLLSIALDELLIERHCFLAKAQHRAVVISLPTFFRDDAYQIDSNTQNFLDYIRDLATLCEHLYVIPTHPTTGVVQDDVDLDTLKKVESIVISGGRIEACLGQTLSDITSNQQRLIFDVQACTDQFSEELGLGAEEKQKCLASWNDWKQKGFEYSFESHNSLIAKIIDLIPEELATEIFLRKVRQISGLCGSLAGIDKNFEVQLAEFHKQELVIMLTQQV